MLERMVVDAYDVTVERENFGRMRDGHPVERFLLANDKIEVSIMTYGARITGIATPDRHGVRAGVVLGMETFQEYLDDTSFQGAIAGRYANRIANGRFSLDGRKYQVPPNDCPNALHGGSVGFSEKLWAAHEIQGGVALTLESADGDQGFPGTVHLQVRYTLHGSALHIDYDATTDRDTVLNVTSHAYFNLAGEGVGNILDHVLQLDAAQFTPTDATMIPTGEIVPVAGTPFDFLAPARIGARIDEPNVQLEQAGGYDHNWVLGNAGPLRRAARLYEPHSGRMLTVHTTQPGLQFYSGNFLNGALRGVLGALYERRTGLCLETQHFPDSPNQPAFPSTTVRAGAAWQSKTVFAFSVEEHPWQS